MRDDRPRQYPGVGEALDTITLEKGIFLKESGMLEWAQATEGPGDYRADLQILHYHRASDDQPARIYEVLQAWPTEYDPTNDLDANTSDVAIETLTIQAEDIKIKRKSV